SEGITEQTRSAFEELVGKQPADIRIAIIENAADTYAPEKRGWVDEKRQAMAAKGYQLEQVDLLDYKDRLDALREKLLEHDVVWFGGGNTFYLRWLLRDTGADAVIKKLVQQGLVYGGASAGAIVAGPTLQYFQVADDPAESPEELIDGLRLVDMVIVPHIGNAKYGHIMPGIDEYLKADGYVTVPLNDQQALVLYDEEAPLIVPDSL
ncbi:MAG TPA: Type 1 glutamine amidotransferase-like domain-containing protein, partial [Candidatus Saccharimonadales bacterium]|nr:Type 1 glutamine amidotransferase-like domain-containing protein [Candidatus Saccharimonadales bacterium]